MKYLYNEGVFNNLFSKVKNYVLIYLFFNLDFYIRFFKCRKFVFRIFIKYLFMLNIILYIVIK